MRSVGKCSEYPAHCRPGRLTRAEVTIRPSRSAPASQTTSRPKRRTIADSATPLGEDVTGAVGAMGQQ